MALQGFAWNSLPEMHSCGMQSVSWSYQGQDSQDLSITITDTGVQQDAPIAASTTSSPSSTASSTVSSASSASSAASTGTTIRRRQNFGEWNGYGGSWLPLVNEQIATGIDPALQSWTWPSVNVTQGWYVLVATIPSAETTMQSSSFFVANGTAVFPCLAAPPPASSTTAQSTIPTSSTTIVATTTATSGNDSSGAGALASSRVNTGAIAGGVVGGVAFLAALAAALIFFLCRRRRRLRARSVVGAGAPPKGRRANGGVRSESFQALSKGHGSHSSSLASVSGLPGASPGVSEEGGLAMRDAGISAYTPATPIARRVSTQSASGYTLYESYGMAAVRSHSQPGAARDAEAAETIHESDEALNEGAPASAARRKPVPKYDAGAFRSADGSTESADANALKRHSFVNMKPMQHVIQPDLPAHPRS